MSLSDFNKPPAEAPAAGAVNLLREVVDATNKARISQEKRDKQDRLIECSTRLAASMLGNSHVPITPDMAAVYAVKCARSIIDLAENY